MEKKKRRNLVEEKYKELYLNKQVQYNYEYLHQENTLGSMKLKGRLEENTSYNGIVSKVPLCKRKLLFNIDLGEIKLSNASESFVLHGIENIVTNIMSTHDKGVFNTNKKKVDENETNTIESTIHAIDNACIESNNESNLETNETTNSEANVPTNVENCYKCSYNQCDIDCALETYPCTGCGKPVHHICSNEIKEDSLNKRYCSFSCVMLDPSVDNFNIDIDDQHLQVSEGSDEEDIGYIFETNDPLDIEQEYEDISTEILDKHEQLLQETLLERETYCNELIDKKNLKKLSWDIDGEIMEDVDGLYKNKYRIKANAILKAQDPISVFMILFPDTLWELITLETNRYRVQKYENIKEISTIEIMRFVGLLMARSLNPWIGGMKNHWRQRSEGKKFIFVCILE